MKLSYRSISMSVSLAASTASAMQYEVSVDGGPSSVFNSIDATNTMNMFGWYSWNHPQKTSANTPKDSSGKGLEYYNDDHAAISVVETMAGFSVSVIFDNYEDDGECLGGAGGNLTSEVSCIGPDCSTFPAVHFIDVLDDLPEAFSEEAASISRRHSWSACRTDGYATDRVSEGDNVCIYFPPKPHLYGASSGIRIYELDGTYKWTDLTTETIGHQICVTVGCNKKKLLVSCDEHDECCSGLCTGRVPGKNFRCHACARKQQICANTAECCQAPGGRFCNNGRCKKCPETGCPSEE